MGPVLQDAPTLIATSATAPPGANPQLAQDFLELSFFLENGTRLPAFTRFEGPISVAIRPGAPKQATRELTLLLARLRTEAGIEIAHEAPDQAAHISIEAIPSAQLANHGAHVACFTTRGVDSFQASLKSRKKSAAHWQSTEPRQQILIVLRSDTSPQDIRACLHEEMAHALGPLNDLWRLSFSVLNDDNFHTVLTPFDMLMLKANYAPELRSGMTYREVERQIPKVLDRLNPSGKRSSDGTVETSTPQWRRAIRGATATNDMVCLR